MIEQTLVIIKPDGCARKGWTHQIQERYRNSDLNILSANFFIMKPEQAEEFYSKHKEKGFYIDLVFVMSSRPSMLLILEGEDAIARVRKINGATNPEKAELGTIRHDFRTAGGPFNTVHGSANLADFKRENALFAKWNVEWIDY